MFSMFELNMNISVPVQSIHFVRGNKFKLLTLFDNRSAQFLTLSMHSLLDVRLYVIFATVTAAATSNINFYYYYCWWYASNFNRCLPLCVLCHESSLMSNTMRRLENVWKIMCRGHNNFSLVLSNFLGERK